MRKAFSLIELVIVIVVIGILAVNFIPRIDRDNRTAAMNHILTMIRYTQNLALHDDKQDRDNPKWQKKFWKFKISKCQNENKYYFIIGSDTDTNGYIKKEETAIDPSNGKYLYSGNNCKTESKNPNKSPNVFLDKYGINSVTFSSCAGDSTGSNTNKHIGFDKFGRVYKNFENADSDKPNYKSYRRTDCRITFGFENSDQNFTIRVKTETGYAFVEENPNL